MVGIHGWSGTGVCTDCKHPFKKGEKKAINEDWADTKPRKDMKIEPKRWAKCIGCQTAHGSGTEHPAQTETYPVTHKDSFA